ncbi:putative toxin-antitoxin system toxin component, PIN family [candidate division WOR-1 bacterium RIFOXYD2_FULL_36_8]|uniref:Putative toxin-antitoxin system toxin component, PIN family n=1 Tax=candidate division WOR-1 bacterium RIFOXYB2_FULL_36_35 TaxID=1802578 RepID=A0A1F4S7G4_UNCSA|nr:MAG: putative toxin-antitoxin system toxin component, PIN family [candidate division WOR-1 bacterium RIFOXYA2_FULL_36_21]OGC16112.1 MAG: putative toxin-antitoxin system toxin component, PIN family [candidate division WOR-1 bacterium RIFOXYA12_FULL_36_13]OGC16359.1 MAG: putative toxin-antitoxin system toxin component, PIN family [candidate division WOR-1 bacterium RIFOXYB2_FULL_36_35]OGC38843.1 MAG: putative toxin-antitoxin system toxin component, PIN family [candidate division WOR-1 bacterium
MDKLKIVLDTNIIISATLTEGVSFEILKLWRKKIFSVITTEEILAEYCSILSRENFCLPIAIIKTIIDEFKNNSLVITSKSQLNLIKNDPSDNKFIETAVDSKANFIVSGDNHLLALKKYKDIIILSPRNFLDVLESENP